jgi:methylglutaconyl-CoA hydratase
MTNEIAHPLVEGGDEDEAFKLVSVDATVDGVVTITMNRPERRNALNAQLIEAMIAVLETVDNQDGIRIVFLRGAGG